MDKSYYRTSLNNCKKYMKLGVFADEVGIKRSALSMFLKSETFDYQISLDKLEALYTLVMDFIQSVK